ncbi:MAG: cyclic pyranopterin monophosphate synthase MoaC [Mycobacteriales bacterium]
MAYSEPAARRSVTEHCEAVVTLLAELVGKTEQVPISAALNRRLASGMRSSIALPPFDNSQMDGYAVRAADLASAEPRSPVRLAVGSAVPAGRIDTPPLPSITAMPIMTGAPIPLGANAVIPIEHAQPSRFLTDLPAHVAFNSPVEAGQFIRRSGSDVVPGQLLVDANTVLHARHLGLLAAAGIATVPVRYQPRILLLSTGLELREPGEPLQPGQIYDANTPMLAAAAQADGAVVTTARLISDSAEQFSALLRAQLDAAPERIDLVVTSGGVSAGAFEVVKDALAGHGVQFMSVAMQPGGPQGLGRAFGVPLLAFPGNPVSAFISYEVFLRPALRRIAGHPDPERAAIPAKLTAAVTSPPDKHQIRRATIRASDHEPVVELDSGPGSHLIGALAHSNAWVHLPLETSELSAGTSVQVWLLDQLAPPREPVDPPPAADPSAEDALPHLNRQGAAHMVDVSAKMPTKREATAQATVATTAKVIAELTAAQLKKGDALGVARVAGILAAKRTAELIPLCHPLPLTSVAVELTPDIDSVMVTATVRTTGSTGVEMEALTAACVASLTLYDMIKALDPAAVIEQVSVVHKLGGKHGEWVRT